MASLSIKASDGKTLTIQIPPGTDPSKYAAMADEVYNHYQQNVASKDKGFEFLSDVGQGPTPVLPKGDITSPDPLEQTESSDPGNINKITNALASGIGTAQLGELGLGLGVGAAKGAMALPEALKGGVSGIRAGLGRLFTTPASAGATPAMIRTAPTLAKALPDVLTAPEQGMAGLGESVAQAARAANAPEGAAARIVRSADDRMLEPLQAPALPGQANAAGAPVEPNTSMFQQPISQGLGQSAETTQQIVKARGAMIGDAIGNTLEGLDRTGSQFDAKPLLDRINGMYQRTPSGELATEGVQGETNKAISDALETIKNEIGENGKMTWKDANRAKSLLQDSGNYAAKRFDMSNEAYKTTASLIKEEIDNQAESILSKTGGNVQQFQQLRQAYAQTKFAEQATANTAAKEIGGGTLGQRVAGAVVNAAKKAVPLGVAYEVLKR